jgi:signal transduction histidine kinase
MVPRKRTWRAHLPRTRSIPLIAAGIMAAATAIECHALATGIDSLAAWGFSLLYGALMWLWWALIVELLWRAGERWPSAFRVSLPVAGKQLIVGSGVAILHLGLLQAAVYTIVRTGSPAVSAEYAWLNFLCLPRFGIEMLIYCLVWLGCVAVHAQLAGQRDSMRSLELQKQLSSAHLRALQMQLEPHFLFNTLNAVTTLVELDRREEALQTLGHLNTVLKTVLKRNTPSKIPFAQELEIVESYLAIERVRFADRLHVDLDLDPATLDGLVPCFLLQPIVENAIRHGIAHCEKDGCIEASARRIGARMQLRVRDNGPGKRADLHHGFGVGLINTRERLSHFYQDNYELRAEPRPSGGFEVSITIPYEKAEA